jgi:phage portal protein BeeE
MGLLDKAAGALGSAVRSYHLARVMGSVKRPQLLTDMAEGERWKGGDFGMREAAERRAMQVSWVFIAIDHIARELLTSQGQMFLAGDDDDIAVKNHPFTQIMANPNPHMDGAFLQNFTDWWQELDGSAYWFLALDGAGELAEIWPLPARSMTPIPGDKDRFVDHYEYQQHGRIFRIPFEYVCHFRYPNPFSIFDGLSRLTAGMMPADSDLAMARWNGSFFGQDNVMPSVHINLGSGNPMSPISPTDIEALKSELQEDYSAFKRRTLITNANTVDFNLMGYSQKDMDFLGGRELTKKEIFLIFGLPPGMLDASATEANATVADAIFKEKKIWPLLILRQGQINNQIIKRYYGQQWLFKYKDIRPRNRQMDIQEVGQVGPYLQIDEVRAKYWGLGPLPGGRGQKTAAEMNAAIATSPLPSPLQERGNTTPALGSGHVPEGSAEPEKGANALQPVEAGNGTTVEKTLTPNPTPALPASREGVVRDLKLWKAKALRSLTRGDGAAVKFASDVIDGELAEDLRDTLGMCLLPREVKAVFELNEKALTPTLPQGGGSALSWRPWSEYETRLTSTVEASLRLQAQRVINEMIDKEANIVRDDPTIWQSMQDDLLKVIEPELVQLAKSAVDRVQASVGSGAGVDINWNLANENAAQWARTNAAEKVRKITDTTKEAIQQEVADWVDASEGMDDLVKRIEGMTDPEGNPIFNRVRAERIATTESTDTFAAANDKAWQAAGYAPAAFKPTAHPKCRCYTQPKTLKDGSKVQVWFTLRDEMVCKKPITTPWGVVEGCSGLHGVSISEGPHMGEKVL